MWCDVMQSYNKVWSRNNFGMQKAFICFSLHFHLKSFKSLNLLTKYFHNHFQLIVTLIKTTPFPVRRLKQQITIIKIEKNGITDWNPQFKMYITFSFLFCTRTLTEIFITRCHRVEWWQKKSHIENCWLGKWLAFFFYISNSFNGVQIC